MKIIIFLLIDVSKIKMTGKLFINARKIKLNFKKGQRNLSSCLIFFNIIDLLQKNMTHIL